jgi:hypothetical protein
VSPLTLRLQIDKIDPLFYKVSQRINIAEETKMSATQTESDEYYARAADARECLHFSSRQYLRLITHDC